MPIDHKQIDRIKSDLHWSGYAQDLAHFIRRLTLRTASTKTVCEVIEKILAPSVVVTKVRLKNPKDRRVTKEVLCRVLVLEVLKDPDDYDLGLR